MGTLFEMIMTKNLAELIDTAYKVKVHFNVGSYELNQYEDGSYVDFKVNRVVDLKALLGIVGSLELKFFCDNGWLIVRLFEKDCY